MRPVNEHEPAPKLYGDLASWWPLLSPPEDYAQEAEAYRHALVSASAYPPRTLLELGSGGGNNASFLKKHFRVTLVDVSPGMLAVSRALNPECEHVEGDMRTLRLGRRFDAVFIHDAVMHLTNESDLRRAMATAFEHCRPGGVALFAPDCVRETFRPGTDHGGRDAVERGLRYLEWTWDPDPDDCTFRADFAYLLREGGRVRHESDAHLMGLFRREQWIRFLTETGFQAREVSFQPSSPASCASPIFVGMKPAG